MTDFTRIAVDAMGGDNAPDAVLVGVESALAKDASLIVCLSGPHDVVDGFARDHDRVEAYAASEVISMDEHPANAVRKKKDSSIVVGCRLVKEGKAQGFFSAGSTGACMAAATLVIGRVKGIKRPAIVSVIPSPSGRCVFCDLGANADCRPEYLVQFALMGRVYAQAVLGIDNPSVALLNIGEEETKGSMFAQECHEAMKASVPNFAGNAQGCDLALGGFDVIVTDGFTGNVALKTYEGVAKALMGGLKDAFMSSTKSKVGALLIKDALKEMLEQVSTERYGGAQLMGVKGICLIGHGNSNADAVASGILASAEAVRLGLPDRLSEALSAQQAQAG